MFTIQQIEEERRGRHNHQTPSSSYHPPPGNEGGVEEPEESEGEVVEEPVVFFASITPSLSLSLCPQDIHLFHPLIIRTGFSSHTAQEMGSLFLSCSSAITPYSTSNGLMTKMQLGEVPMSKNSSRRILMRTEQETIAFPSFAVNPQRKRREYPPNRLPVQLLPLANWRKI